MTEAEKTIELDKLFEQLLKFKFMAEDNPDYDQTEVDRLVAEIKQLQA